MFLMHGMACHRQDMLPVLRHLQSRYRCVSVDLRGHGESDKPLTGYAMDDFVADIDHFIETLDLGRPLFIGHSFGGSIALDYADRWPDRIAGLVLLDSGMRSNEAVKTDLGPFYESLRTSDQAGYAAILEAFVRARLVDPVDGDDVAAAVASVMAEVPAHVFLSMSGTVEKLRSAEMAARYQAPGLLVMSRQAFADRAAVARLGANWHIGQVVGAGHFVQLVQPQQVNLMIDRFLELTAI